MVSSCAQLPKKSLLLSISACHLANEQGGAGEDRTSEYEKAARKVFEASGLFSEVGTDLDHADLELVLNIEEEEHFSEVLTFLCGFTLLIIPTVDRVTIDCEGSVHSGSGAELGEVSAHEEVKVLIGWIALPAIPTTFIAVGRGQKDVFKSVLVQMAENSRLWR
ncbi:MAG: hypothetical protein ACYS1C_08145 [Planctomycetota bacterium]